MRYRVYPEGERFRIFNEDANLLFGSICPRPGGQDVRYSVENDHGDEVALVASIDEAIEAWAAYVPPWERISSTEYERRTDYGDLRVQQIQPGRWVAYRDGCELGDENGPTIFSTLQRAQSTGHLHVRDLYPSSSCVDDGLSWLGAKNPAEEWRHEFEEHLGHMVAEAVATFEQARVECRNGGVKAETRARVVWLMGGLYAIWDASGFGSFDAVRGTHYPFFLGPENNKQEAAPARMSFDEASQHYGKIALRERVGPDVSDSAIEDMIADLLARVSPDRMPRAA